MSDDRYQRALTADVCDETAPVDYPHRQLPEPPTETAAEVRPEPCRACPWRTDNHGRSHPDGWYTTRNRDRLWSKLRRGEGMSCHPTDPGNPVSERAQDAGYRPVPEHAEVRECVGALVLQQREGQIINDMLTAGGTFTDYRKRRPRGLTREGIAVVIERLIFGGTLGTRTMPKPNLNTPVGHAPLPWPPRRSDDDPAYCGFCDHHADRHRYGEAVPGEPVSVPCADCPDGICHRAQAESEVPR